MQPEQGNQERWAIKANRIKRGVSIPSIKDESTVKAIARAFVSNGRKQEQAMIDVGYTPAYANSYCGKMWDNPRIKAAIACIDDKTAETMDLSRNAQYKRLLLAYDMAVVQKSPTAIKSVLAEINLMLGYQREAAPNKEKEQAIADRMTKEDKELAMLAAKLRTEQEARRGLKLA